MAIVSVSAHLAFSISVCLSVSSSLFDVSWLYVGLVVLL